MIDNNIPDGKRKLFGSSYDEVGNQIYNINDMYLVKVPRRCVYRLARNGGEVEKRMFFLLLFPKIDQNHGPSPIPPERPGNRSQVIIHVSPGEKHKKKITRRILPYMHGNILYRKVFARAYNLLIKQIQFCVIPSQ